MKTLIEIEAAIDALPRDQKEELFLFLAMRLRGVDLSPRQFTEEEINNWIADDEVGMRRLFGEDSR